MIKEIRISQENIRIYIFLAVAQAMLVSLAFVVEFWIKDFSRRFSTITGIFIIITLWLIITLIVVEKPVI